MYSGTYTIKLKLIDEKSPDREVVVYRNNKETSNYKYIKYKEKDIILCYQKNAVINQFDVEGIEELIVVLPNKSEVISKILKEEKWKREYFY